VDPKLGYNKGEGAAALGDSEEVALHCSSTLIVETWCRRRRKGRGRRRRRRRRRIRGGGPGRW